ncbi:MAG: hypothetical protein DMF88_12730 [Acidobacteria bacterium]|nr:MAG: hypothetical protein DMF88_12730 [Acidobacteriota bacterium]
MVTLLSLLSGLSSLVFVTLSRIVLVSHLLSLRGPAVERQAKLMRYPKTSLLQIGKLNLHHTATTAYTGQYTRIAADTIALNCPHE